MGRTNGRQANATGRCHRLPRLDVRLANGVIAHQIAAKLAGSAASTTFDGVGYCYLETGGGRAVKADGSFFELPNPVMRKQPPDEAQFKNKLDWVARQLAPRR